MRKKLFLVVSIFTMFLIGSSAVKADTNKVYWNLGGENRSIYDTIFNSEKEELLNNESFIAARNDYCSNWNDYSGVYGEFASEDECKEAYLVWELNARINVQELVFSDNSSYNDAGAESVDRIDVSKDQDEKIILVLHKDADNQIFRATVVYDGILELNPDSSYIFENMTGLSWNNIDTSKVTNMSHMFEGYGFGESTWDNYAGTAEETSRTINFLKNFDTSNVTDMSYMFANSRFQTLNLGFFDTSKVTNMSHMFEGCSVEYLETEYNIWDDSIEEYVNVANFDTSNVTNMSYMFADMWDLKDLDVSRFNTSKVTNMSHMFYENVVESLDLSNFDTSKVTDMSYMFAHFSRYSSSLREADLSNFNTKNVTNMTGMFEGNRLLSKIYVGNNFKTDKLSGKQNLFVGSKKLVGQAGTTYDVSEPEEEAYWDAFMEDKPLPLVEKASSSYARIDEKGKPGYFSVKAENDLKNYDVSSVPDQTYTGKEIKPNVTVKGNTKTLVKDKDYTVTYSNNVNAGTASIIVDGINNCVGRIIATFKIKVPVVSISNTTIGSIKDQTYTGKAITPSVTVTYNGKTLVDNTDYTVAYKNNTNTGLATVTVTGKGNYNGTKSATFLITPTKVSNLKVTSETQGSIYFSWTKAPGNVTGYSVYKYIVSKKQKVFLGDTTDIKYGVKSLKEGTTYQFRVTPYTIINGEKYYGEDVSLTSTTKTKKPSIKLSSKVRKVTIKWNKVAGANGYEVYMSTKKNSGYKKIKTTTGKSFTKTKLTRKKRYYFKVRTYRKVNGKTIYSYYSPIKSIKVK